MLLPPHPILNLQSPLMRGLQVAGPHPRWPLSPKGTRVESTMWSSLGSPVVAPPAMRLGQYGLEFDGSSQRVWIYPDFNMVTGQAISMFACFSLDTITAIQRIMEIGLSASTNGCCIRAHDGVSTASLMIDAAVSGWTATNTLSPNTWYNVAFSLIQFGNTPLVCVNGVQWTGSGTVVGSDSTSDPLHVGGSRTGTIPVDTVDGVVGAFALWNRALTLDELLLVSRNPGMLFQQPERGSSAVDVLLAQLWLGWQVAITARN